MKNRNAKKYEIISGKKYGPYLALEEVVRKNIKSVERVWKVKHLITEKETIMRPSYLIIVEKKYNEKLLSGNFQQGLKNYLFKNYKTGAKRRNHEFTLTIDEFEDLISRNCFYCNSSPQMSSNKQLKTRGHINEPPLFHNGIDRINSEIGYHLHNCIPCCGPCNYMKNTMSANDFLEKIEIIYNNLCKNEEKKVYICGK